jgi:hypothetical protein
MSCYVRHLTELFAQEGLEYNKPNRQKVDKKIRALLELPREDCPVVWKRVKPMLADAEGRQSLEQIVREVLVTQ